MDDEQLERDLRTLENSLDSLTPDGTTYQNWFVSFGSLLYIIRDKNHGIEFTQDIDISIVGEHQYEQIKTSLQESGFTLENHIVNDVTGDILFADFKSKHGLNVDLFFWIEHNGYLWHTYDDMREKPSNGIPEKYYFKAVPTWMMTGQSYKYRWFDTISPLKIPHLYGTLLDYWYPHWFIPDAEFGQSRTKILKEPTTCKNLSEVLCLTQ